MSKKDVFVTVWKYLKGSRIKVFIYLVLMILTNIVYLIYPYFWANALSALINKDLNLLLLYLACWSGLSILSRIILDLPIEFLYKRIEISFIKKFQTDLYNKTLNLPAIAYEKLGSGEIVNRVFNDPKTVTETLGTFVNLFSKFVCTILIFIYMINISIILAIELFIFGMYILLLNKYFKPKVREIEKERKKIEDEYLKTTTESFNGIREIRALGIKDKIKNKVKSLTTNLYKKDYECEKKDIFYGHFLWEGYFVLEFIMLLTSAILYFKGIIPFESFVLVESYANRVFMVIQIYSEFGMKFEKLKVALGRMIELLNNKLYNDVKYGKKELKNLKGNITFENITFGYDSNNILIDNFNLEIPTNKKVAIVGKSGMGKSTLFNMLLRYFDPIKGDIKIDNTNLLDLSENSLNNVISIIRQDPFIFNMSIKENFEIVKPGITLDEIKELCKSAYIDEYFSSLKDGYDTIIGEGGVNLSGGQKQRLAIARALAKNSKIILFDEATSALDNLSQSYIKKTIDSLSKNHTVLIIAHRLSTIEDSDIIVVMNNGKVEGIGSHEELMQENKSYKSLYSNEVIL